MARLRYIDASLTGVWINHAEGISPTTKTIIYIVFPIHALK